MDIKLLSFDLDGTFLDDNKNIPEKNLVALKAAAERGVHIVPTSGRLYAGMPKVIRDLPFVRYCITGNGAQVYDAKADKVLCKAEIPKEKAIRFLQYADKLPVIYNCYKDDCGYMADKMRTSLREYIPTPAMLEYFRNICQPVDELKRFILEGESDVQKMMIFFKDMAVRQQQMETMPKLFPDLIFSSGLPYDIEVNSPDSSKGRALASLCRILGIDIFHTLAIGDGSNDIDMIATAGFGVAMANAIPALKAEASYVTSHCNDAGFAQAVEQFVLK